MSAALYDLAPFRAAIARTMLKGLRRQRRMARWLAAGDPVSMAKLMLSSCVRAGDKAGVRWWRTELRRRREWAR